MESAIPEIFRLALKNDKEKNAQDDNEKVLEMNKEKIQNFRISFFDSPLGFQANLDLGRKQCVVQGDLESFRGGGSALFLFS